MTPLFSPLLAEVGQPLFGNQWLALAAILVGITAFLFAVAAVGRWLAATHPDEPAPAPLAMSADQEETPPEIFAVIAAAIASTLGASARVANVAAIPSEPVTAAGRQQWSMEGRRQIYSSHKVR